MELGIRILTGGVLVLACASVAPGADAPLRVPAFTAYVEPENAARVATEGGITRWRGTESRILWFGELKQAGTVQTSVVVRLPADTPGKLRLKVGNQSRDADVARGTGPRTVSFGEFAIKKPGYVRFELTSLAPSGSPSPDVESLLLDGNAVREAHFNLDPRRNAASVHLHFPVPPGTEVAAFYNEIVGLEDPAATYYEACGFARGYFGMQVNSPAERRIIFSVWDAGTGQTANRRDEVAKENHVQLLTKGEGVVASVFGGEGTGGHSHLVYPWKTGSRQRFLVTAKPSGTNTDYTGYWFHPEERRWKLIASFRAPKDGQYLRGLYSFNEDFDGGNGQLRRKALFGPQWVRTPAGQWKELTEATFTHDPTGKANRLDRFGGVEKGLFFLSNGGFVPGTGTSGERFTRPATGRPPQDVEPLPMS